MKRKVISLALAAVMTAGLLTGCGGSDNSGNSAAGSAGSSEAASEQVVEKAADPREKYEEPVTLTSFFSIAAPISSTFDEDEMNNSYYYQQMEEKLNIKMDWLWYAQDTTDDGEQKKNVAIASGEIPDYMLVTQAQLSLLAKSNLINKDIGTIFEQYATEETMAWTTGEGDAALQSASYDGKIIAIPLVDSSIDGAPFLWIRQDWLDKLGLKMPTTMDELYDVMVAFKEQDPDGNGQNDTVGMVLHKNFLTMATGDAVGLFNGFGAYPTAWIDDGNGGLMYGSVAPEAKAALDFLAKMYKNGLIEEDFSSKDEAKSTELVAAGTAGIQYGAMYNAIWPLQSSVDNDPNANWVPICIVSSQDGKEARPQISLRIVKYVVVSAKCEHPEAVVKALNFWVDAFGYSSQEEYDKYLVDYSGTGVKDFPQHWVPLKTWNPLKNLQNYYAEKDAEETGDTSKLNAEQVNNHNDILAWQNGDLSKTCAQKTFGPTGSAFEAMDHYYQNDLFLMNAFTGAPTETMQSKLSIVQDKVLEYYTKVIMGIETTDSFDDFVAEVNALGLEDITKEVNEWYTSK